MNKGNLKTAIEEIETGLIPLLYLPDTESYRNWRIWMSAEQGISQENLPPELPDRMTDEQFPAFRELLIWEIITARRNLLRRLGEKDKMSEVLK